MTSFNNNGYTLATDSAGWVNSNGEELASWTFRKAPGFFDCVQFTGNGSSQNISHSLEATVGCYMIKQTSGSATNWYVWHRKLSNQYAGYLELNNTSQEGNNSTIWNQVRPTTSTISVGNFDGTNKNNETYIAYVFAEGTSDSEVFGEAENASVIKCGSYTGNGQVGHKIELGWEPSFIIFKNVTDNGDNWEMVDVIRGNPASDGTTSQDANFVRANTSGAEFTNRPFSPYSTGFEIRNAGGGSNGSGKKYVYIAIRRSDGYVGKPASAGTDVLAIDYSNGSSFPNFDSNFIVDYWLAKNPTDVDPFTSHGRLTGNNYMRTSTTGAESSSSLVKQDSNVGVGVSFGSSYLAWMFKRHAGMDVVCYDGTGSAKNINHSLNKVAEMMWVKVRSRSGKWTVYHKDMGQGYGSGSTSNFYMYLNETDARVGGDNNRWDNTAPTSSVFTVGTADDTNKSGHTFISILFASISGISKVGSYTGDDSDDGSHVIDVGFTPRFLIIKRSDSSTDWKVYDTTNGFPTSGTANYVELNTSDVRHTGGVTVTQTTNGFKLWSSGSPYNANNGKYIYYAHA